MSPLSESSPAANKKSHGANRPAKKWKKNLDRFLAFVSRLREIFVQVLIFLYMAATPFPNNMLSGALAFIGYPLRKAVLPIVLGDIAFCLLIAWLASQGIKVL